VKILFAADVAPDPDAGASGTELQTINSLRRLGHDVDTIWADELGRRIRHGNLHYLFELPGAFRRAIGARCASTSYDVIHANQGHSYLAAMEHRRRRRPGVFVCRSHGLDDHMELVLAPWRRRLDVPGRRGVRRLLGAAIDPLLFRHDRLAYRNADGVLVSSSNDARFLASHRGVELARIGCVPQAPAAAFVASPAPAMTLDRLRRVLHVGGFAYWKGVHAVAATANQLFASPGAESMTWVCRESEHDSVRELLSGPARERVQLLGWTSQAELCSIYDRHGLFLYPSLFDGFGKVFLEAMARGLCVIGTAAGGMPDVISQELDGVQVGFNDSAAMAARIRGLWAEPARAEAMSRAAAAKARQYTWDRVGAETLDFYRRLTPRD
jgi:glycosyltransferase involved in cell wall biosynthesis